MPRPGPSSRALRPLLGCGLFCLLLLLVRGYEGTPSITWMNVFDLDAFRTPQDVWTYLLELRTGIPPLLSALELLWWVEFRDLSLFSRILYPACIALAFTAAVLVQPRRPAPMLAVLAAAPPLAALGTQVHAGNPALYDPLFAALLLGYFALTALSRNAPRPLRLAAAGTLLAALELTRPFMIYLLPLFLLVEIHRIRRTAPRPGSALLVFLIPVLLISGGWHLHLHHAHDGQIPWTNISGYNLQRAWWEFHPEIHAAKNLEVPPKREGLWGDLNRSDVYRTSEAIKGLILARILDEPVRAAGYAADRIVAFASAPTRIYGHDPQGPGIALYRAAVTALVLTTVAYVMLGAILLPRRRCPPWLYGPWWLGASVLLIALLVAVAEKGEEARFLFSILPLLLAMGGFALDAVLRGVRLPARRLPAAPFYTSRDPVCARRTGDGGAGDENAYIRPPAGRPIPTGESTPVADLNA